MENNNKHTNEMYYDMFNENEMAFGLRDSGTTEPGDTGGIGNRTTIASLPTRSSPPYSYPNAVTSARAGSRSLPTTIATTRTSPGPCLAPLPSINLGTPLPTATAPPSSTYPSRPTPPSGFQSGLGWNSSSSSNSLYNSGSDNSASNSQLLDFGYSGQDTTQPGAPIAYNNDFIPQSSIQQSNFNFGGFAPNPWRETSDTNATILTGTGAPLPLPLPSTIHSRSIQEENAKTEPEPLALFGSPRSSGISRGHKRPNKFISSETRTTPSPPLGTAATSNMGRMSLPSIKSGTSSPEPNAGSSEGNKTKLRSASRTSKNTHHKTAETAEQRKTRSSHNLVEKQYRNRLNTQFESLLNALPDTSRGSGEQGDAHDGDGERRVSKAEVLDLARRHIRQLEKERNDLERENNELIENMEKLQETYSRGLVPDASGLLPMVSTSPTYQNTGTSPYADNEQDGL